MSKENREYYLLIDREAIDIIAKSLTPDEFKGFCLGNILKYRLRAGKKDSKTTQADIDKANHYEQIWMEFTKHE